MTKEIKAEIKAWVEDILSGKEVETVSMGGISESYENAIQEIVFISLAKIAEDEQDITEDAFPSYVKSVVESVTNKPHQGYSGAQVGASENFVAVVFRHGIKGAFDMMRKSDPDRIIKRNKFGVIDYKD